MCVLMKSFPSLVLLAVLLRFRFTSDLLICTIDFLDIINRPPKLVTSAYAA